MDILQDFNLEKYGDRVALAHFFFYFPRREPGNSARVGLGYAMDELLYDKESPQERGWNAWVFKVGKVIDEEIIRRRTSIDDLTQAFSRAHGKEGWSENPKDFEMLYGLVAPIYKTLLNCADLTDREKASLTN